MDSRASAPIGPGLTRQNWDARVGAKIESSYRYQSSFEALEGRREPMLLSIVIPVYNEAGNLHLTLRALQASVDGRPAKILQTNSVFRGLPLGPGSHTIEFHFRPRCVYTGAVVSLVTLALCSYGLFRSARLKRSVMTL